MNKLLSIIIPTYNMGSLLPRCIDSLVRNNRNLDRLEILVINDGSTDNSLQIAKEYEAKYPSVVYAIDKSNGNYGSTINKGIELATGKYFRILDSDDYYNSNVLSKFIDVLDSTNADLVLSNFRQDRGGISRQFSAPRKITNQLYDFASFNIKDTPNFTMHGITYKTSILQDNKISLLTGISYTDSEFCFYPLAYVKDIYITDLCVYCYQLGRPGQTVAISSLIRCIPHMIKIIKRMNTTIASYIGTETFFTNQLSVMCNSITLCLSTVLCYDTSNQYLVDIDEIVKIVERIPEAKKILNRSNMYGVPFYKRYVSSKKMSNNPFFIMYYSVMRSIARTILKLITFVREFI